MKKSNVFWGIFFIFCAVYVIANRLGFMEGISILTIILTILFVITLIKSIYKINFWGILFSMAFLAIIYDEQLQIEEITPWPVLVAALLGSIGLSLIFSKSIMRRKNYQYNHFINSSSNYTGSYAEMGGADENESSGKSDSVNEKRIYVNTNFGTSIKYVDSDCFEYGEVRCNFSNVKIYFDNTIMAKGNAALHINVHFGSVEIYVPKNWKVVDLTVSSFSGKNNSADAELNEDIKSTLSITGEVSFGSVNVKYL